MQAARTDGHYSLYPTSVCVLYGGASGPVTTVGTSLMSRAGPIFFTRPGLAGHLRGADEINGRMADLFARHLDGSFNPQFDGEYSLADVPKALAEVASGRPPASC